jgi:hypothetical protein
MTLKEGEYQGVWSAYKVQWSDGTKFYMADTANGVRGINCPCTVEVKGGVVTIK